MTVSSIFFGQFFFFGPSVWGPVKTLFLYFMADGPQRARLPIPPSARLSLLFSFPCSADYERDWPPFKVFFSGWQPIR